MISALIYVPATDTYEHATDLEPTYDLHGDVNGYLGYVNGFPHWTALRNVELLDTQRPA